MKKVTFISEPNLYTAIATLYTIRNYLTISSFASRAIFTLFFLMSIYYYIKSVSECNKYPVVRMLLILTVLLGIYGFLLVLSPPDSTWLRYCLSYQFLCDYLESLLPIFAFVYFSKKNMI